MYSPEVIIVFFALVGSATALPNSKDVEATRDGPQPNPTTCKEFNEECTLNADCCPSLGCKEVNGGKQPSVCAFFPKIGDVHVGRGLLL
ncbi:hypothetical protein J7T55_002073 [Diaporthe amygdali]|uniref:uncharacterized protein n=1 Tax=Phomopsis amygdali TaxID=1214568 RepID=UPI0022FDEAD9|nr:uncharacterized protein J7T55_002073 [Diaporthe amygdali]KAJ0108469.1 hypothetical protein J7T55_002073 [Diaporthe amygdali]